jgi:hypothetical protein
MSIHTCRHTVGIHMLHYTVSAQVSVCLGGKLDRNKLA